MTIDNLVTTSGFASEEPITDSALFGSEASNTVWLPDEEEGNWYSPHVSREVEKQTGRRISPHFTAHRDLDGRIEYECFARIGRGAWRAVISSGRHPRTLAAMDAIIERINQIPIETETDWHLQLPTLLPYKGMAAPQFKNEATIGMPAIRCTLEWGIDDDRRTVVSQPFFSRGQAFSDAVQLARKVGPVHATTQAKKKPKWEKQVRERVSALPTGYALAVQFHTVRASNQLRCQITWAKGATGTLESSPMPNQQAAFDDAVRLLKKRFPQTAKVPKGDGKQGAGLSIPANELLAVAIKRWNVERSFLFKQQIASHSDTVRLNLLSGFLVILDPLRCYEIEKTRRIELVRQLHDELAAVVASVSTKGKQEHRIRCLRMLIGSSFKEAGVPVAPDQRIEADLQRKGLAIADEIRDLLEVRYLRQDADNKLTLSTIGANALEAALTAGARPGAVASALPLEMAAFLTDLKAKLAEQRRA